MSKRSSYLLLSSSLQFYTTTKSFCAKANDICWCNTPQVGNYYLFNGDTKNECPYTSCSNAGFGQKYTPGFVDTKDKCPTVDCPEYPAPAGFYFATAGSCELTRCSSAKRGTFYTHGCNVGTCTNGNARSKPTQILPTGSWLSLKSIFSFVVCALCCKCMNMIMLRRAFTNPGPPKKH